MSDSARSEDLGVEVGCLLLCAVGEEFHLVELMYAQQALRVLARRACLATKADVWAHIRIGKSAASTISSRPSDVSGTSAVGMAHRSSCSMWYASSMNFGKWPVATIVSVRTSVGGRISS